MNLRRTSIAVLITTLAWACWPATARSQGEDPWQAGQNWISVRAGYAKASGDLMGHGGPGFGAGYSRMLSPVKLGPMTLFRHWSLGAYVHYEQLGRFASARDVEIPITLELVRHIKWSTPLRPYLGFGVGAFFRKTQNTAELLPPEVLAELIEVGVFPPGYQPEEVSNTKFGAYLSFGANTQLSGRHLLGFDGRLVRVDHSNIPPNPVFGQGAAELTFESNRLVWVEKNATHWSAKINYTFLY